MNKEQFKQTNDFEHLVKETEYLIEANTFEYKALKQFYGDSFKEWISTNGGFGKDIRGSFVSFNFILIDEVVVCFWYPTSKMVDYNQIENYFRNNFKKIDLKNQSSDSNNFSFCINYIKGKKKYWAIYNYDELLYWTIQPEMSKSIEVFLLSVAKDDERKLIATAKNDEERKEFQMNVFGNYEELGYKITRIKIEK